MLLLSCWNNQKICLGTKSNRNSRLTIPSLSQCKFAPPFRVPRLSLCFSNGIPLRGRERLTFLCQNVAQPNETLWFSESRRTSTRKILVATVESIGKSHAALC